MTLENGQRPSSLEFSLPKEVVEILTLPPVCQEGVFGVVALVKEIDLSERVKKHGERMVMGPVYSPEEFTNQIPQIRRHTQGIFDSLRPFKTKRGLWRRAYSAIPDLGNLVQSKDRGKACDSALGLIEEKLFDLSFITTGLRLHASEFGAEAERFFYYIDGFSRLGMQWAVVQDDSRFEKNLFYHFFELFNMGAMELEKEFFVKPKGGEEEKVLLHFPLNIEGKGVVAHLVLADHDSGEFLTIQVHELDVDCRQHPERVWQQVELPKVASAREQIRQLVYPSRREHLERILDLDEEIKSMKETLFRTPHQLREIFPQIRQYAQDFFDNLREFKESEGYSWNEAFTGVMLGVGSMLEDYPLVKSLFGQEEAFKLSISVLAVLEELEKSESFFKLLADPKKFAEDLQLELPDDYELESGEDLELAISNSLESHFLPLLGILKLGLRFSIREVPERPLMIEVPLQLGKKQVLVCFTFGDHDLGPEELETVQIHDLGLYETLNHPEQVREIELPY